MVVHSSLKPRFVVHLDWTPKKNNNLTHTNLTHVGSAFFLTQKRQHSFHQINLLQPKEQINTFHVEEEHKEHIQKKNNISKSNVSQNSRNTSNLILPLKQRTQLNILLMVQKSHSQPPGMQKKTANNWINYRSLNGFKPHQNTFWLGPPSRNHQAVYRWLASSALRGSGDCGSLGTFSWCAWRTLAWTASCTGAGGGSSRNSNSHDIFPYKHGKLDINPSP